MDWGIYAGDTNKTIYVRLRDSTTGLAKTGLVYNSAGAVASYTLPLAARAAITLATQTVTGAHSDGGFVEVDATNCKGLYRLDLPDAAIASGAFTVISIEFDGVIEESVMIELHTAPQTGDSFARIGAAGASLTEAGGTGDQLTAVPDTSGTTTLLSRLTAARAGYLDTLTSLAGETRDANILDQFKRVLAMIEHMRESHTGQPIGDVFFVDPVNGDTHANGNRGGITDPYLTLQDCHDNAVTDSNHDVIILLSGAAAGETTHTVAATTTLSKRYLFVRGPGRDFIITRTGSGDTLAVTADGIELSGFQLGTAATGSGVGLQITDADFCRVEDVWINDTRGDGINILRGENCIIRRNSFTTTGQSGAGDGIQIDGTAGASSYNRIEDNYFRDVAGDAIVLGSGTVNSTVIRHNMIRGSTGWGIRIGAAGVDTFVTDNRLGENDSGNISDSGTTTIALNNEQWGTATAVAAVPTAVENRTEMDSNSTQLAKLGTPAADVSADIAAVKVDTAATLVDTGTTLPATLATAQADLDILTGADGVNLLSATQASIDAIEADTNELQTDWVDGGRLDLLIDSILSTGSTGPWTSGSAGATAKTIDGRWGRNGSSYYWIASLSAAGVAVTSGISAVTAVGVYGQNGDTDLGYTEATAPTLGATHRMYGAFTLTTAPTDGNPAFFEFTFVYATVTYRARIPAQGVA